MARPIAIIFALDIEAEGVVSRLSDVDVTPGDSFRVTNGALAGADVVVVSSGPGARQAHSATSELISRHQPVWVISAGFSGGLVPAVRRGDVVMADSVADERQNVLSIDLRLDGTDKTAGLHVGRVLSVARVVVAPNEKQQLGESHSALAVDLESFAVAEVCAQEKVRFLAVRVVSDPVEQRLPDEVRILLAKNTAAGRWGAVAGSVMRRPSSLRDLWTLRENAINSSDRLGQFLEGVVTQLAEI